MNIKLLARLLFPKNWNNEQRLSNDSPAFILLQSFESYYLLFHFDQLFNGLQ